jgi:hypothetical protein
MCLDLRDMARRRLEVDAVGNDPLIPIRIDHDGCAQSLRPMDMMRHGWAMSLFQA